MLPAVELRHFAKQFPMAWSFTPAAQRALAEAAGWTSRDGRTDLGAPELLQGLLAEAESRAASILLAHGVDAAAVQARWPALTRHENGEPRDFAVDVMAALDAAAGRLWDYPRPLSLATEHLLLGLVAAPGEVSHWLAERGFDADELESHIHQLHGHDRSPLELPIEADAVPPPAVSLEPAKPAGVSAEFQQRDELLAAAEAPDRPVSEPAPVAPTAVLRILDAAANRAREGLRVVEDYARMALDDRFLTGELKSIRHELRGALERLPAAELLASRDTLGDVGTTISTAAESVRADLAGVVAANFKRLQEALRSLEEYSKLIDPTISGAIERLRYRCYTIERAFHTLQTSADRFAGIRVCVLIDGRATIGEFEELVGELLAGGVRMIQLRDKRLEDRELLERAVLLRTRTAAAGAITIINDRADIAAAAHADGVHVGQDDLPVNVARAILGSRAIVGLSTHSIEQARYAVLAGADYIGVGPTFPSTTKQFDAFTGVELLRAVAAEIRLPAFAIGGIDHAKLNEVARSGIKRVAVSGAIISAPDVRNAAQDMVTRLSMKG